MKLDDAAERIVATAVALADLVTPATQADLQALKEAGVSIKDAADVLHKCSEVIEQQRFGPQGGSMEYNYNYRQWVGYHPPGFTQSRGDVPVPGE